ncbi:hypothetical protein DKX38_017912 [Salix brachista]|uniref:Uncharacterized protein n=1 Tax=Salix brachista TaxID=2182728 RepID=A0A5N5KXS4_9ROSI|nr:hypothetical protein DKX38_017912 [Salix brachista]
MQTTLVAHVFGFHNAPLESGKMTKGTKVKIKITKKQLKELLGMAEVRELSVQQVLSQLMNLSSDCRSYEPQQQSWRPNLQSIPE